MTAPVAPSTTATPRSEVFELRDVTKVYRMGEVDVRALDGVSLSGALDMVHVHEGRRPTPGARDEVMVSAAFAAANGLRPGATLGAVLGERWRRLKVVGLAMSPEFVYVVGASGLFPDDRRYGVLWMENEQLAPALNLDHAFNDVLVSLTAGARPEPVVGALDRLLAPYGGGSYDRERQSSHRFLSDEIEQNRAGAVLVPAIFLAIAAFLTHLVLGRLVATRRTLR